jgi:hypothetical protein
LATKKHECLWRTTAAKLERELADKGAQLSALTERMNALEHKLALATKQIIGPKTERMPTPEEEAKKRDGKKARRGGHTNPKKRKENAEALAALPTTEVLHPVPESERSLHDDVEHVVDWTRNRRQCDGCGLRGWRRIRLVGRRRMVARHPR